MPPKRNLLRRLIGDIVRIAVAIAHLAIGKYYNDSIPPLALFFYAMSLMWLIWGIVSLQQTITIWEAISDKNDKGKP